MTNTTHFNLNIVEGSDKVNPLTQVNPNFETIDKQMFKNAEAGVTSATHLKSGNTNNLTRINKNCSVFRFVATSDYVAGDSFAVDGAPVTAIQPDGSQLSNKAFVTNANIICVLIGSAMTIYTNSIGKAPDSAKLNGQPAEFYAKDSEAFHLYTQNENALTGSGSIGRFIATKTATYTQMNVGGEIKTVNAGGEPSIDLVLGAWYTFIIDGETINFNRGSGLSKSKLALATATEEDVAEGKTFFAQNNKLKTGVGTSRTIFKDGVFSVPFEVSKSQSYPTFTFQVTVDRNITLSKGYKSCYMTSNTVDLSKYNYLKIEFGVCSNLNKTQILDECIFISQFAPAPRDWNISNFDKYIEIRESNTALYLDISKIKGSKYLGIFTENGNKYQTSMTITSISLGV